jgi:hypothetical protein
VSSRFGSRDEGASASKNEVADLVEDDEDDE